SQSRTRPAAAARRDLRTSRPCALSASRPAHARDSPAPAAQGFQRGVRAARVRRQRSPAISGSAAGRTPRRPAPYGSKGKKRTAPGRRRLRLAHRKKPVSAFEWPFEPLTLELPLVAPEKQ